MKYLVRNSITNVIEMMFETPITPSPPMEVIPVDDAQYRVDMLSSIFTDVNRYKPYPSRDINEQYWVSNGTNWVDPRPDDVVWEEVRRLRDEELADSDWTQLADSGLTPGEVTLWANYRANLRASTNVGLGSPRVAETTIVTEKDNRPGRNDNDPRRGRGQGNKPIPRGLQN
jgi:hypothetical protein